MLATCFGDSFRTTAQSEVYQNANAPEASANIVISQFQVAGGTANDEFIELHNIGLNPFALNGFRVVYRSAAGTNDVAFVEWTSSTIIAPGGYYLIGSVSYDGLATPNNSYNPTVCACSMSATGGGLAIRGGALNSGIIFDSGDYGTATDIFKENAVTSAPLGVRTVTPVAISRVGSVLTVGVVLNTNSGETLANSLSFTLNFSTADLIDLTNIRLGGGGNAANLSFNDTQAGAGRLGVLLDLAPLQNFGEASQQLVLIDFTIPPQHRRRHTALIIHSPRVLSRTSVETV